MEKLTAKKIAEKFIEKEEEKSHKAKSGGLQMAYVWGSKDFSEYLDNEGFTITPKGIDNECKHCGLPLACGSSTIPCGCPCHDIKICKRCKQAPRMINGVLQIFNKKGFCDPCQIRINKNKFDIAMILDDIKDRGLEIK